MKADHDKKIQEALDKKVSGLENIDDPHLDAYKMIYDSLKTPVEDFALPPDFANHLILKIEKRKNLKSLVFLIASIGGCIAVFIAAAIALTYFYPSFGRELNSLFTFNGWLISLLVLLVAIQLVDWWLVKRKSLWYS